MAGLLFWKKKCCAVISEWVKKHTKTHRCRHIHTHIHIYKHQSFTLVYQSDLRVRARVRVCVIVPVFFTFIYLFTVLLLWLFICCAVCHCFFFFPLCKVTGAWHIQKTNETSLITMRCGSEVLWFKAWSVDCQSVKCPGLSAFIHSSVLFELRSLPVGQVRRLCVQLF